MHSRPVACLVLNEPIRDLTTAASAPVSLVFEPPRLSTVFEPPPYGPFGTAHCDTGSPMFVVDDERFTRPLALGDQ